MANLFQLKYGESASSLKLLAVMGEWYRSQFSKVEAGKFICCTTGAYKILNSWEKAEIMRYVTMKRKHIVVCIPKQGDPFVVTANNAKWVFFKPQLEKRVVSVTKETKPTKRMLTENDWGKESSAFSEGKAELIRNRVKLNAKTDVIERRMRHLPYYVTMEMLVNRLKTTN
jgi:hypothetical protein